MFTWNIKTSCVVKLFLWEGLPESWAQSTNNREKEIDNLNKQEVEITRLLRACYAEQKKTGISKDKLWELNIEIQNLLTKLDSIRKKSAELRDQRGKILWKTSNFLRNNWNKLKDTARPLSLVSTHSEKKLEQAKVMNEAQEQEKKNMEEELKKKKNDLVYLSRYQNPELTLDKTSIVNSYREELNLENISKESIEIVEKSENTKKEVEKIKIKKQETQQKKQETLENKDKQKEKTQKTNDMFLKLLEELPENQQKEFTEIISKWLTDEEKEFLDWPQNEEQWSENKTQIAQKKMNAYVKIYTNFTKHIWGKFLDEFKKSKNIDTPLWKEIENYLNQKNPGRDKNQIITDDDIESLKNDSDFLQIFVGNSQKIDEYKVPEWTYEWIFDKNVSSLMWSVNSWYGDNMKLIGTGISVHNSEIEQKNVDEELVAAIKEADEAEQKLVDAREDIIRQIEYLDVDIKNTDTIINSINICRLTGEDSSLSWEDISNMTLDYERPMICFDNNDTPVLYFINKKWERTMIMLFAYNNPITLTGSPTEIKKQMDMVVEMQKYPIVSNFIHTPWLLTKAFEECSDKYPDQDPRDPNNKLLLRFILSSIYNAVGIENVVTSDNLLSEMNRLSQDHDFTQGIQSKIISWWLFDPVSGRLSDRILSDQSPPDFSSVA